MSQQLAGCVPQVSEHGGHGLAFKHTADHKLIVVDPSYTGAGDDVQRTQITDPAYLQAVLFDHHMQLKNLHPRA